MASLARRGAAPLRGRDGRAGILAAFGRRGVPRGWPRLARGPGRAGAGAQLRGRHAPVPRGRASLPPQVPPAAHRGAQDQRGCLGRQGGDRVGAHRPRHGEGPGAGGRRGLARRVAHGHGARAGHAGDGGAGGGRNPVRRQGDVRDGQPRRAHRPRRDREADPDHAAQRDRGDGAGPRALLPRHHQRQAARDPGRGDAQVGREGEPRRAQGHQPAARHPRRDGEADASRARSPRGDPHGGGREAVAHPAGRGHPAVGDQQGRRREAGEDPLRRGGGGRAAQGGRRRGPGHRADHDRHQGNRGRSRAILDRDPLYRGAQGHGHEPAEQQGDLPALRGDGRAVVAGRHPGDAGGAIGKRRETRMNWKTIAALALAAVSLSAYPANRLPVCDSDNGGLTLPAGFCALVVADQVGAPRHIAVAPNGDLFVALESRGASGGVLALRDTSGDGKADLVERFGVEGGTGVALGNGALYVSTSSTVYRYAMRAGSLKPLGAPDVIVKDLPTGGHSARNLALSADGKTLFVNIGSPSNSCQVADRALESRGKDPCPELATRAGIWRFDATAPNQTEDEKRYATGIRNAVGLAFAPDGQLWATQHGRDQLGQNWPKLFTVEQNAEKPSEELVRVRERDDFGWPYCYHDLELGHLVLAPEYGGDGKQVGRCAQKQEPAVAFPGHWAPDGLTFYTGAPLPTQFPARYMGGAFIAFHGSWNRAPLPQAGYRVVFVPFRDGRPVGTYETFADGVWHENGAGPQHRPVGVAVGPDGPLYSTGAPAGWGATPM